MALAIEQISCRRMSNGVILSWKLNWRREEASVVTLELELPVTASR